MLKHDLIKRRYEAAKEIYALHGTDTEPAISALKDIRISMHCWQGDDLTGLESVSGGTAGGIMSTGSFPGKPRNGDELRMDIDRAMSLIPGKQRLNLHASYAETGGEEVGRDRYETRHFRNWIDWAKSRGIAMDFNPTCFGHPMAAKDMTLSSADDRVRGFWTDHCIACRKIAADIGKELGERCINNIWVPDGMKDMPADRMHYRKLLMESLDSIFEKRYPAEYLADAVECKLFGIGIESFTAGSHEFYIGYAARSRYMSGDPVILTLDMGHFHPTETISDKISALLLFIPELLVHCSRGVRWDSDHTVISDDALADVMREIKRADAFDRVNLATDFFDASINRIAAWTIGVRAVQKAVLAALLEPTEKIRNAEKEGNYTERLVLMEEARSLPSDAVWDWFCLEEDVPVGSDYLEEIRGYEMSVLSRRD